MEGPYLPEGSGGEQPPEELSPEDLAQEGYEGRMRAFDALWEPSGARKVRKRRYMSDYTTKNCEEAWGQWAQGSEADDRLGRHVREPNADQ